MYTLTKPRTLLVCGLAVAALLGLLGTLPVEATPALQTKPKSKPDLPPMADQTIPGSPVRAVARDSGSVGIYYGGTGQFTWDFAEGVYIWADGQVWGPAGVPFGPSVNPYTPVSNVLTGAGTAQVPWRVVTTLRLGDTGLQLVRSVRYINGDAWTRHDFEVLNSSNRAYTINLFQAADLRTAGVDEGYGFYDSVSAGIGGYNQERTFYQLFIPISAGSRYKEGISTSIWSAIGNVSAPGSGFDNSYLPDEYVDNGAGLQWTFGLGPRLRASIAAFHSFTTSPGCAPNFADVFPSDFYFDPVLYLTCEGAISGYSDNTFRPGNNTTRAQLSKIVVIAQRWNIDLTGAPHFSDVPSDHPFHQYIETAYNHGVISGYQGGTFRPSADVTRAQLAKIIVTAEGWPIDTSGGPHFSDVPTSHPFYSYVETARNRGIISGYADDTFRPNNSATRGQIAKIVHGAVTAAP